MNQDNIRRLQEEVQKLQQSLSETVSSENSEVTVVINGNLQLTALTIKPGAAEITPLIIDTINRGIKKISETLKVRVFRDTAENATTVKKCFLPCF